MKNKGVTNKDAGPAPVVVDPKLLELAKKLVLVELPLGTGSSMLKSIICDAMVQRGLAVGEAVTELEVKTNEESGKRTGEATFRTVHEATECLEQLNQEIEMMGTNLTFERPPGYQPIPDGAVGCGLAGESAPPPSSLMDSPTGGLSLSGGLYGGAYGVSLPGMAGAPGSVAAALAAQQQRNLQVQMLQQQALQHQQALAQQQALLQQQAGNAGGAALAQQQLLLLQVQRLCGFMCTCHVGQQLV